MVQTGYPVAFEFHATLSSLALIYTVTDFHTKSAKLIYISLKFLRVNCYLSR